MSTSHLRRQHDAAVALADEIRELIRKYQGRQDAFALSLRLAKLVGVLRIHFAQEDKHLYPSLIASADAQIRSTAEEFYGEMGSLGPALESFASRWTSTKIADAFDAFQQEANKVLDALTVRIERENAILYPLADKNSELRMGNAA